MTKVMRSKTAKHGKRLNGKMVAIRINKGPWITGEYKYYTRDSFWIKKNGVESLHSTHDCTVEEIIETEK